MPVWREIHRRIRTLLPGGYAPWLTGALALLWTGGIVAGFSLMLKHDFDAGAAGQPPMTWPADSELHWNAGRPTLVLFVHPHCRCSHATLTELSWILAHLERETATYVVFLRPDGADPDWVRTDLWLAAQQIDGVTVVSDSGGTETRRFGATTAGHTLLYDASGRLQFTGGITASRGHVGSNVGRKRIVDLIERGWADRSESEVYGCALSDSGVSEFMLPQFRGRAELPSLVGEALP